MVKNKKPGKNISRPEAVVEQKKLLQQKPNYLWLLFCIIAILASYVRSAVHNDFVYWDDNVYGLTLDSGPMNQLLNSWNIGALLTNEVDACWHPFTMFVYMLLHHAFGSNPAAFHLFSLFFHICNTTLLFLLIFKLTRNRVVTAVVTILFSVHPVQVESVAWVSEYKNELYAIFFLGALLMYTLYIQSRREKKKWLVWTWVFFVLSLLSKALAVTLPLMFMLIEYYHDKNWKWVWNWKTIVTKAPFFLVACGVGMIAVWAQKQENCVNLPLVTQEWLEQLNLGCYALVQYIFKLLLPIHLSGFYRYPIKTAGIFSLNVYLSLLIVPLIIYTIVKFRNNKKIIFGMFFFLINIFLVLQFLPVGGAILADRYLYIPSIGFFWLVGYLFNYLWEKYLHKKQLIKLAATGTSLILIFFTCRMDYVQAETWKDSETLWTNAIIQDSTNIFAYDRLGLFYYQHKEKSSMRTDSLNLALAVDEGNLRARMERATLFTIRGRYDSALNDINIFLDHIPTLTYARTLREEIYRKTGRLNELLAEYQKNQDIKMTASGYMDIGDTYVWRGRSASKAENYSKALENYTKAIELEPKLARAYFNRGQLNLEMGNLNQAYQDLLNSSICGQYISSGFMDSLKQKLSNKP